jgi:hypothetical protein
MKNVSICMQLFFSIDKIMSNYEFFESYFKNCVDEDLSSIYCHIY